MIRRTAVLFFISWLALVPSIAEADAVFVGASPASNSTVGGTVTSVEIVFNEIVSEATITIDGPEGAVVPDRIIDTGQVISASFAELTVEGRYVIRYVVISADTDPVEGAFAFTYREGAPAPLPVVAPALDTDDGPSLRLIVIVVMGVSLIGVVAAQTAVRTRRLRQLTSPKGVPSDT